MAQKSRYAARPITNGSSGQVAQAATQEFKRIEQVLNDKTFPMPGMDNAYNAAAFPGTTDEAKITRAIAQAAADGVDVVWIPASMLPYDASLVTFNTAVHMFREGGNPSTAVFDPLAYGAGLGDSYYGLQAALNAMTTDGTLEWDSTLNHSKPLWVKKAGSKVVGNAHFTVSATATTSCLQPTYQGGPTILAEDGTATIPELVSSLLTGSGQAIQFTGNNNWFNLRSDFHTLELHGLPAFSVRVTVKPSDTTGGFVVGSSGRFSPYETANACFFLSARGADLFPQFLLNLTSGNVTLTSSVALTAGVQAHLAGDYDGSTIRLFVDGVLRASQAATGTLVQDGMEDVLTGHQGGGQAPDLGAGAIFRGTWDSLEISKASKHTVGFTPPTAKYSPDSNTLALMNFDEVIGPLAKVYHDSSYGYAWYRQRTPTITGIPGFECRGVVFSPQTQGTVGGVYIGPFSYRWAVRDCNFTGCWNSIMATIGDVYGWQVDRVYIQANGAITPRFGICTGAFGGLASCRNVMILGCKWPIRCSNSQISFDAIYLLVYSGQTIASMYITSENGVGLNLTNVSFSAEGASSGTLRAQLILGNVTRCTTSLHGCFFETPNGTPFVIIDGIESTGFHECQFANPPTPPSSVMVIKNAQGTLGPIRISSRQTGTWTPWADVAGSVILTPIGKGMAITFSATPTFDCSLRDSFEITLTANVTSSTLSNVTPGQRLTFWIKQDATGGRTFVWPTNVKGAGTIDGTVSKASQQEFEVGLDGNAYAVAAMVTGL